MEITNTRTVMSYIGNELPTRLTELGKTIIAPDQEIAEIWSVLRQ